MHSVPICIASEGAIHLLLTGILWKVTPVFFWKRQEKNKEKQLASKLGKQEPTPYAKKNMAIVWCERKLPQARAAPPSAGSKVYEENQISASG